MNELLMFIVVVIMMVDQFVRSDPTHLEEEIGGVFAGIRHHFQT